MVSDTARLEDYFAAHRLAVLPATARRDENHIRLFQAELDKPIEAADRQDILDHIYHLMDDGASAKTVHNHVASISNFYNWRRKGGLADRSPLDGIDLPKIEMPPPIYLTPQEYPDVIDFAEDCGIATEIIVALNTGLRMTELRFLHWADVDEVGQRLKVRRGKGGKFRVVPLNRIAVDVLARQRLRYGSLGWVFPGASRGRAGKWDAPRPRGREWWLSALKPFQNRFAAFKMIAKGRCGRCWHLFRHSFATTAVSCGVPIFTLSQWLGHQDVKTTMRYAHLIPAYDPNIEKVWPCGPAGAMTAAENFKNPSAIFHTQRGADV